MIKAAFNATREESLSMAIKLILLFLLLASGSLVAQVQISDANSVSRSDPSANIVMNYSDIPYILAPFLISKSNRITSERNVKANYLRHLRKQFLHTPTVVRDELSLNDSEFQYLVLELENIHEEDIRLTEIRIERMCEVWRSDDISTTDVERANHALQYYTQLEESESLSNFSRERFFIDLSSELSTDSVNLLQEHMNEFARSGYVQSYSWESLVRSIGMEVEQLEFSCGPQPPD